MNVSTESAGRPLRVLLLGEDAPGALMHSYRRGFEAVGARVETYCLVRAFRGGLGPTAARVAGRVLPERMLERFNRRVLEELGGHAADVAVVLKGERLQPATVAGLKAVTGARVANYYPDDPFADVRSNRLVYGPAVLREYDHCFTFASNLLAAYESAGATAVSWLPFARDPEQHAPVAPVEPPEFDVMFAGNLDAERVRWLEPIAGKVRLAILAEHTRAARGSALRAATFLPTAYGRDLPRALARASISLNIMRLQNRLNHNMRSYESPACGAFTLSQRTPELERLFREDEEIAFVDSPDTLGERVAHWLARPAERRRIARAGFERVATDTYEQRARTILETLGVAVPAVAA